MTKARSLRVLKCWLDKQKSPISSYLLKSPYWKKCSYFDQVSKSVRCCADITHWFFCLGHSGYFLNFNLAPLFCPASIHFGIAFVLTFFLRVACLVFYSVFCFINLKSIKSTKLLFSIRSLWFSSVTFLSTVSFSVIIFSNHCNLLHGGLIKAA